MSIESDPSLVEFERRIRAPLEASVETLNARVRSRLTRARYAALEAAGGRRHYGWRSWAPAGAVAAALVISVFAFEQHRGMTVASSEANTALEDIDLLSDSDALEMAQEQDGDYDFYEWAADMGSGAGTGAALGT
jgi:hypothetical protein